MTQRPYGRDRRRRLSAQEAGELFAAADGRCRRCGTPLGIDWHQAHLVAYTNGGATNTNQMQAWCRDCNLRNGAADVNPVTGPTLRAWQAQAMDIVLERLWQTGTATVHAAPG
ncbi:MAG: HNH endonuclease, partial [Nocardioides sp.]